MMASQIFFHSTDVARNNVSITAKRASVLLAKYIKYIIHKNQTVPTALSYYSHLSM